MRKHYNIRFHGRVQGVFFRDFVRKEAKQLGLSGFVRNEPDDSVYAEAEGEEEALQKLIAAVKIGPPSANVEKVKVSKGELKNFYDFEK